MYSLVGGAKNYEEFRSLVGNQRIVAAYSTGHRWEVVLVDYGVLRASALTREGESPEAVGEFLDATHEPLEEPKFASQHVSHDEVRLISQWLLREGVRLLKVTAPELLSRSTRGGDAIALPTRPSRAE